MAHAGVASKPPTLYVLLVENTSIQTRNIQTLIQTFKITFHVLLILVRELAPRLEAEPEAVKLVDGLPGGGGIANVGDLRVDGPAYRKKSSQID